MFAKSAVVAMTLGAVGMAVLPAQASWTSQRPAGIADTSWPSTTAQTGLDGTVKRIEVQPDGKYLVAGHFGNFAGQPAAGLVRLNPNGTRDASFALPGSGFDPKDKKNPERVNAFAVQSDGKILAGGSFVSFDGSRNGYLLRLNADGSLDPTFGKDAATLAKPVRDIVVQPDGRILVAGDFSWIADHLSPNVIRLLPDGTLDRTFSANGLSSGGASDLALQADGKILVAGNFFSYGSPDRAVVRLNPDGSTDPGFHLSGRGPNNRVLTLAVQPDRKILIGGLFSAYDTTPTGDGIARLNPDGTLDPTFHVDNRRNTSPIVGALALQPDGKILVGGDFGSLAQSTAVNIGRLNPDGTGDRSFDTGYPGLISTGPYVAAVWTIVVLADGNLLAGGSFTGYQGVDYSRLVRLVGVPTVITHEPPTTPNPGRTAAPGQVSITPKKKRNLVVVRWGTVPGATTYVVKVQGKPKVKSNHSVNTARRVSASSVTVPMRLQRTAKIKVRIYAVSEYGKSDTVRAEQRVL